MQSIRKATRLAALMALAAAPATAAPKYWDLDGGTAGLQAGNGTWDTGTTALWSPDTAGTALTTWANGDDAVIQTGGANALTLVGTISASTLTIGSNNTVTSLQGGTIQLNPTAGNAINVSGTGASLTINSNVVAGNTQTWGANNLTVNGTINGTGTVTVGNTGTRFFTFNGDTNLGGLSLSGASGSPVFLTLGNAANISGIVNLNGAGTRVYGGGDYTLGSLTFGAAGVAALGGNNTFSTGVTVGLGGNLYIERDANLGTTALAWGNNGGTLRILGTQMTSFGSRTVTISEGAILDIADAANTFTFSKVLTTAELGSTETFVKSGMGTLVFDTAHSATGTYNARGGVLNVDHNAGGSLNSTAKLALSGGTFVLTGLNGGTTTQTLGTVTVSTYGGTIRANGGASSSTTLNLGAITTAVGSYLNFGLVGATTPVITTTTTVDATGIYGGRITYNGQDWATTAAGQVAAYAGYAPLATAAGTDSANSRITAGGTTTLDAGAHVTNTLKIDNAATGNLVIGSGNSLALTGGGLLFTGDTAYSVDGGSLASGTATASDLTIHTHGDGVLTINSVITNGIGVSTLTKTGPGTLVLGSNNTYTGQTYITGGILSGADFNGTSSIFGGASATTQVNISGGTLQYTGVTDSTSRTMSIGANGATIDIVTEGVVMTWSGELSNTAGSVGSLTKNGAGTLLLTTASNSFTGGVFINGGVLQTNATGSLNNVFPNTVTFGAGSTGTLRTNGTNIAVGGLNTNAGSPGAAIVENNAATAGTLTVNSAFASTFAGTIRDGGSGALALTKVGGNSLTLTGTNTYSGLTNVVAGKLVINGSLTNSNVNVAMNGALGGGGTVAGAVTTAHRDSLITPGAAAGTLTVGSLDVSAGATLRLDLGATSGGTASDVLAVTSALTAPTLDDGSLVLEFINNGATVGTPYTILTFGSQTNLTEADFTTALNGLTLDNAFDGNGIKINSNDVQVQFSAVPEPASMTLLAMGLSGLLKRRRRTR